MSVYQPYAASSNDDQEFSAAVAVVSSGPTIKSAVHQSYQAFVNSDTNEIASINVRESLLDLPQYDGGSSDEGLKQPDEGLSAKEKK